MGRWDDVKKLKDAAVAKVEAVDLGKVAGDAVLGASDLVEGAQSVAERSGLTKKNGQISKVKVVTAVAQPRKNAKRVLDATAEEIRARRDGAGPSA